MKGVMADKSKSMDGRWDEGGPRNLRSGSCVSELEVRFSFVCGSKLLVRGYSCRKISPPGPCIQGNSPHGRAEPWVGSLTVGSASVALVSPASITSLGPLALGLDHGLTTRDERTRPRLLNVWCERDGGSPIPPLMAAYDETHFMLLTFYRIR